MVDIKDISVKLTKNDYDKLSKEEQNIFPFYCPEEAPFLCSLKTPNYGLCKVRPNDCHTYVGENILPTYDTSEQSRADKLAFGKQYNYDLVDRGKNCSRLIENSSKEYNIQSTTPNKFKIITYNIWNSMQKINDNKEKETFNIKFLKMRMSRICKLIIKSKADIVCLQEVSNITFHLIYPKLKDIYPFYYEKPFDLDEKVRKRNAETICFSKFPAISHKLYGIEGNLSYNNSMLIVEYDKFIVFNVYLQAGTKNSPGQQDLWFNYSRCRYNEFLSIDKYIKDNNLTKPFIVAGDFNTDLNGSISEWPELKAFEQLNLQDAWLADGNNDEGFTENTDINLMRWNVKFEEKKFRIDGIFYTKGRFTANKLRIAGVKPISMSSEMETLFIKYRVPTNKPKTLLRLYKNKLKIWPSDHFAVIANIELT